jgi:hypothetical protein
MALYAYKHADELDPVGLGDQRTLRSVRFVNAGYGLNVEFLASDWLSKVVDDKIFIGILSNR